MIDNPACVACANLNLVTERLEKDIEVDPRFDRRRGCARIMPGRGRLAIAGQPGSDVGDGQDAGLRCVPRSCARHTWRSEDGGLSCRSVPRSWPAAGW